ncbi:hypothetical protein QL093DRAFT_2373598 [Fusarium oxysporum]|nr:hypothetical protein QL093DRAFT_2373598 [Fusarium oxysporum]
MSRSLLIVYLACLAFLPTLISAQSCSTTGTYAGCCPSSDKKIVTFQGKDYRVYCDVVIAPGSVEFTSTPAECANRCGSMEECVDSFWEPPRQSERSGRCEMNLLESEAQSLAIVPMASAGPTQCDQDLQKCRTDLATCQRSLSTQQANCASQVSTQQANCASQVSAQQTSCTGRISSAIASYASALAQCQRAVASAGQRCGIRGGSQDQYQILRVDSTSCKQNCLADSRCLAYSFGVTDFYRNVCYLHGKAVKDLPFIPWPTFLIFDRNCP